MTPNKLYKKGVKYYNGAFLVWVNRQKAFDLFLAAFEAEPEQNKKAFCEKIVRYYSIVSLKKKDMPKAIYLYTRMAEYGYANAQYQLGLCYYYMGDLDSMDKAVYWLDKVAEQGHKFAKIVLMYCHDLRTCRKEAHSTVEKWYDRIVSQGSYSLLYMLCNQYEKEGHHELATEWNVRIVEYGNLTGLDDISCIKRIAEIKHIAEIKGKAILNFDMAEGGAIEDSEYGLQVIRKKNSYAQMPDSDYSRLVQGAELGNPIAQYNLGICHKLDLHSTYDYPTDPYGYNGYMEEEYQWAVSEFQKAATHGLALAQNELGKYYYKNADFQKALECYTKAAESGCAFAQHNLGLCYYMGLGVERSLDKARKWFLQSAMNGFADAQYNFAAMCLNSGSEPAMAFEWLSKAAAQNVAKAHYFLGNCYFNGYGVEKSYEKAVECYTKAARKKNKIANAQSQLGVCHQNGYGVEQSDEKAIEWFEKAGMNGISEAQYMLGKYYLTHNEIVRHIEQAEYWLGCAKKNLHQDAEKLYEENKTLLTNPPKHNQPSITKQEKWIFIIMSLIVLALLLLIFSPYLL